VSSRRASAGPRLLGVDVLEASVFLLQLPRALHVVRLHATVAVVPLMEGDLADSQLSRDLQYGSSGGKLGHCFPELAHYQLGCVSSFVHRESSLFCLVEAVGLSYSKDQKLLTQVRS
jgi:hypothetical protein